jgi:hypothetical protein
MSSSELPVPIWKERFNEDNKVHVFRLSVLQHLYDAYPTDTSWRKTEMEGSVLGLQRGLRDMFETDFDDHALGRFLKTGELPYKYTSQFLPINPNSRIGRIVHALQNARQGTQAQQHPPVQHERPSFINKIRSANAFIRDHEEEIAASVEPSGQAPRDSLLAGIQAAMEEEMPLRPRDVHAVSTSVGQGEGPAKRRRRNRGNGAASAADGSSSQTQNESTNNNSGTTLDSNVAAIPQPSPQPIDSQPQQGGARESAVSSDHALRDKLIALGFGVRRPAVAIIETAAQARAAVGDRVDKMAGRAFANQPTQGQVIRDADAWLAKTLPSVAERFVKRMFGQKQQLPEAPLKIDLRPDVIANLRAAKWNEKDIAAYAEALARKLDKKSHDEEIISKGVRVLTQAAATDSTEKPGTTRSKKKKK